MTALAAIMTTILLQYGLHYSPWRQWLKRDLEFIERLSIFHLANLAVIVCLAAFETFEFNIVYYVLIAGYFTKVILNEIDDHVSKTTMNEIDRRVKDIQ